MRNNRAKDSFLNRFFFRLLKRSAEAGGFFVVAWVADIENRFLVLSFYWDELWSPPPFDSNVDHDYEMTKEKNIFLF